MRRTDLSRTLFVILTLILSSYSMANAQFTPTVTTSFDNLNAGSNAIIEQNFMLFEGQQGPAQLDLSLDRGSFDFSGMAVGSLVGTVSVDVFIDNPFPFPDVSGVVEGDVVATSVGTSVMTADTVITFVSPSLVTALALLGFADPTGEVAFIATYTDLAGDSGVSLEVSESGALPLGTGVLDFGFPIQWISEPFYSHSPVGGILNANTVMTSTLGEVQQVAESFSLIGGGPASQEFVRGDFSSDGVIAINDAVALLAYLFQGDTAPNCMDAADCNDDGAHAIDDVIFLLGYLFLGDAEPPAPGVNCGEDASADSLGCISSGCP